MKFQKTLQGKPRGSTTPEVLMQHLNFLARESVNIAKGGLTVREIILQSWHFDGDYFDLIFSEPALEFLQSTDDSRIEIVQIVFDQVEPNFHFHDDLKDAKVHSAVLALHTFEFGDRRFLPQPEDLTGTVTFIRYGEKCYAVTAKHVVTYLTDQASERKQPVRYYCPVNTGLVIRGPFVAPPREFFPDHEPDVAITPIDEAALLRIGKRPFVISDNDPVWPLPYAMATGFPTAEKKDVDSKFEGVQLSMGFVRAVAAGNGADGKHHSVTFYSDLDSLPPISKLSGMSGGPVFWSDADSYGLVGFVKEALEQEGGEVSGDTAKVHFWVQRVDQVILRDWINHVEENWPHEREKQDASDSLLFKEIEERNLRNREDFFRRSRRDIAYLEWCAKLGLRDRKPRKKNAELYLPEWM